MNITGFQPNTLHPKETTQSTIVRKLSSHARNNRTKARTLGI